MKRTVILAWGNDFHRDDGAGRKAAAMLRGMNLPGVEVHDFNQLVPEHCELLIDADLAIFLDAYPAAPGQGALLLPLLDQQAITLPRSCFGHAMQPHEIAKMAMDLYGAQTEAWLAAIPGFEFDLGEELSDATQRGVDVILQQLATLIHEKPEPGVSHACACEGSAR